MVNDSTDAPVVRKSTVRAPEPEISFGLTSKPSADLVEPDTVNR